MKKKIFTSSLALIAISFTLFSQTTRERLFLTKGHYYVFKSFYEPTKVMAIYDGDITAKMETYVPGKANQIWKIYDANRSSEKYTNIVNAGTNLIFNDKGMIVQNGDTLNNNTGWLGWDAWDLERSDDKTSIRFCHFLERWEWSATYEPQYKGVFLTLNPGENDNVTPFLYPRALVSGVRDYTAYNAAEGLYFDFVPLEVSYTPSAVPNLLADNIDVSVRSGSIILSKVSGMNITIFSMDGRSIKQIKSANSVESIPVQKGVYIIKVNNGTQKVVVD